MKNESHIMNAFQRTVGEHFFVRPAWANSNGCKSRMRPDSGKHIVEGKGVYREVESEEKLYLVKRKIEICFNKDIHKNGHNK